jgi:hypothetical protein
LELVVATTPTSDEMLPAAVIKGIKLFLPDKRTSGSTFKYTTIKSRVKLI